MKKGWAQKRLCDVCEKITDGTHQTPKYFESGHVFLSSKNVTTGKIDWKNVKYIDETQHLAMQKRLSPRKGDILLAKNGTTGVAAIVDKEVSFDIYVSLACLRPLQCVLPEYLLYFVNSNLAKEQFNKRLKGVGVPNLHLEEIREVVFPLPPLEEQQRIVAILDEAFEGLDRARANAEANLQNARELFENSLFHVFDEIASNAVRMTLADVSISFGRGRSRHRPRNAAFLYGGAYPFVQTGDIRNSDGTVLEYSQTYNEHGLAQSKLWPKGTICITIAANIAETAVLGFDACFPDSIIGLVADPKITFPEYVEYMLRYFAAELKAMGKGSAQDNINLATFENATFPFPSLDTQKHTVDKLSALFSNTASIAEIYKSKIRDVEILRQSLLQKAFAGELT